MSTLKGIFSFPNPVNEIAARLVAGMVFVLTISTIVTMEPWLLFFLAYGFLARVATGPTLSPMGILSTKIILPMIGNPNRAVPGPPKRFAQSIGLVFSVAAFILAIPFDLVLVARSVLSILAVFAALESFVGFCAGCFVFNRLIQLGIVPESVCQACVIPMKNSDTES
jgi:hypothetical protein